MASSSFAALTDVMRRNAETAASNAAVQHALAGAGETIWPRAEQEELIAHTEEILARCRRAGKVRADLRAADIGMMMCGLCSSMGRSAPGFDWRRHLELIIDMLRPR